jgi:hypothetical protein
MTVSNFGANAPKRDSSNLEALFNNARTALTSVNTEYRSLLDGQNQLGKDACLAAYKFTIGCMDDLGEAKKLPGWEAAKVQSGSNPYCQPLKLLVLDLDEIPQWKISIWASVFYKAHCDDVSPEDFLALVDQNNGMRRFYDLINKAANDNEPIAGKNGPTTPKSNSTPSKTTTVESISIVQQVENANQIQFVVINKAGLLNDESLRVALEQSSVFLGFTDAKDSACRKFLEENDTDFIVRRIG